MTTVSISISASNSNSNPVVTFASVCAETEIEPKIELKESNWGANSRARITRSHVSYKDFIRLDGNVLDFGLYVCLLCI